MARVAVVTGGTRGIGEAISVALKKAGFQVAANYAGNEERAKAFSERTGIAAFKWDVSDFDQCLAGIAKIEATLGPIDVVVNNAGITRDGTMKKMTRQAWDQVMDTNLGGCFNMCKAVWEGMLARGFGRIVNIGSINGQAGQYGQVNYAAAKSGIHGFTKALAQRCRRMCWRRSWPASRSSGWVTPMRSPAGCCSWWMTMPVLSPDRRCPSTAANTCIEPQ